MLLGRGYNDKLDSVREDPGRDSILIQPTTIRAQHRMSIYRSLEITEKHIDKTQITFLVTQVNHL
jgi:hypothetical protein